VKLLESPQRIFRRLCNSFLGESVSKKRVKSKCVNECAIDSSFERVSTAVVLI
jgi:hypothetical protein